MNPSPLLKKPSAPRTQIKLENNKLTEITPATVYEILRDIQDPEHPHTLEELNVISIENISIFTDNLNKDSQDKDFCLWKIGSPIKNLKVIFVPTIPHCSMASFIGLCLKKQLFRYIPSDFHITVQIKEDSHVQSAEMNKQLDDKDRVYAAFENENIRDMLKELLVDFE